MNNENNSIEKLILKPNDYSIYCFQLAKKVYDSGYIPTILIGVWRGGTEPAIRVHEFFTLKYPELEFRYDSAIKAASYTGINKKKEVTIEDIEHIIKKIKKDDRILIIDDIWDTGETISKLIDLVNKNSQYEDLKTAAVYFKPKKNITNLKPDYYVFETDKWVVFPHELNDLSKEEIIKKDPRFLRLLYQK